MDADPLLALASFHEPQADHHQWDELQELMGSIPEAKAEDTSVAPPLHEAFFETEDSSFPVEASSVREVAAAAEGLFAIPDPAESFAPSDPSGIPTEEVNELLPSIEQSSPSQAGSSERTSSSESSSKSPESAAGTCGAVPLDEETIPETGSGSPIVSLSEAGSPGANDAGADSGIVPDGV